MKILVIGLGNPILTDDAAGLLTARQVAQALPPDSKVDVTEVSVGGIALMETMVGYEHVILIDSMWVPENETGQVLVFDAGALPETLNTRSTHDADLPTALALGRRLGAILPDDAHLHIVAITCHEVLTFGDSPTPRVAAAVPVAAARVLALLGCPPTGLHNPADVLAHGSEMNSP